MSQCDPTRQSDEILPPITGGVIIGPDGSNVTIPSSIVVVSLTANTVQAVDLTTMPQTPVLTAPTLTVRGSEHTAPLDQYITLIPLGALSIAFGPTATPTGTLSTTATNTITAAGVVTANNNVMIPLSAGSVYHFRVPAGSSLTTKVGTLGGYGVNSPARFLYGLATANTSLAMWVSSR